VGRVRSFGGIFRQCDLEALSKSQVGKRLPCPQVNPLEQGRYFEDQRGSDVPQTEQTRVKQAVERRGQGDAVADRIVTPMPGTDRAYMSGLHQTTARELGRRGISEAAHRAAISIRLKYRTLEATISNQSAHHLLAPLTLERRGRIGSSGFGYDRSRRRHTRQLQDSVQVRRLEWTYRSVLQETAVDRQRFAYEKSFQRLSTDQSRNLMRKRVNAVYVAYHPPLEVGGIPDGGIGDLGPAYIFLATPTSAGFVDHRENPLSLFEKLEMTTILFRERVRFRRVAVQVVIYSGSQDEILHKIQKPSISQSLEYPIPMTPDMLIIRYTALLLQHLRALTLLQQEHVMATLNEEQQSALAQVVMLSESRLEAIQSEMSLLEQSNSQILESINTARALQGKRPVTLDVMSN